MAFGVFDRLHEGHRHFLRSAKQEGDWLIAVVTPDHIVHDLKGHMPDEHEGDRMEHLRREGLADDIVLGDAEHDGSWRVVRRHRPHVIALGYDQKEMRGELDSFVGSLSWPLDVRVMPPHEPRQHHSSLRRSEKK